MMCACFPESGSSIGGGQRGLCVVCGHGLAIAKHIFLLANYCTRKLVRCSKLLE